AMLAYAGDVDVSEKPHQQRLREPLRTGARDWRRELRVEDVRAFEAIAGDLLAELGYELSAAPRAPGAHARLALARYRATLAAWNAVVSAFQRTPLWRWRHPPRSALTSPARSGHGRRADER
ncbi:MAG: hypothetical protein NZL88_04910, partial [Gaiellaceae bacterium]|nr:hypothetical protein [Gaiellaceae bacterium]